MELFDNVLLIPSRIKNAILLKYKKVAVGKNLKIEGGIIIYGKPAVFSIGDNCRIVSCRKKTPWGGTRTMFSVNDKVSSIEIGDNTGISNSAFRIKQGIKIGNNVNIGGDCKFYDSDMHSVDYADRISIPDEKIKTEPITIKDGAWIGAHSIILKGVTIGKRSVVAAGSVVTKSIPDDELWGGNPAKFLKKINMR